MSATAPYHPPMASGFYTPTGVFIISTFPVGGGFVKHDIAYSPADARALVARQRDAITYSVTVDGQERTYDADSCSIWEIQANNGGRGPLVTGYTKFGDWKFDGLGGATPMTHGGDPFAPSREIAERALAGRPDAVAPSPEGSALE
jgi:hypothetical protein